MAVRPSFLSPFITVLIIILLSRAYSKGGQGELYTYLPHTENNTSLLLAIPPKSIRNPDYGFSVGRGSFNFTAGAWNTVSERVRLNDVGVENGESWYFGNFSCVRLILVLGEIEVRLNGEVAILVTGLTIRTREDSHIQGIHVQTFFGGLSTLLSQIARVCLILRCLSGSKPDWASPKDQHAWFADFSGAIVS